MADRNATEPTARRTSLPDDALEATEIKLARLRGAEGDVVR